MKPLSLEQCVLRRAKINRTASLRLGKRVRSVEALAALASAKRSVYHRGCWGLLPAIVVMNMHAGQVLYAIQNGYLFEYNRPTPTKAQ